MREAETADGARRGIYEERPRGGQSSLDGLILCLAEAAHAGALLAGGPLSKRKTSWLLAELSRELRLAEQLVDELMEGG